MTEMRWLILCAALAAGEALGRAGACAAVMWPLALGAVPVVALLGCGLRVRGWLVAAVFGLGLALALRAADVRQRTYDAAQFLHGAAPYCAEFAVEDGVRAYADRDGAPCVSFNSHLGPLSVRVICPCAPDAPPVPGERWKCAGWMSRQPERAGGRYPFWVRGTGTSACRVGEDGLVALRRRIRSDLSARLGLGLDAAAEIADLHRAILLGERARLNRPLKEAFVCAGTIHVFAISGLHVVVVAGVLYFLLLFTGLPARLFALVLVPALWSYAYLTGLAPSAVRATAMLTLYHLAPLCWRRSNGLVAWALTFLGVYGISPERIGDVGCWMSFAVMLALVAWGRWGVKTGSRFLDGCAFTAIAWAASLPIAAHVFGRITPAGLLANLFAAPLAAGSVGGGIAGVLASFVSRDLASLANNLTALCTEVMVDLSQALAAVPGASFDVTPWTLGGCLAWYAALALGLAVLCRRLRRTMI